ncbi:hypothetical protein AR546_00590 [Leptospira interrogans serovar Canicola]|nr:hypothetical protein B2G47_17400 [Leptospira interrogans serovar Canicola]ASV08281.1 hypothetical protein B2G50_02240 [Leptospira interrogans serovar Canicola]OLZ33216.1 hypothetical protein AR546_00590 [Leptospira interrogans serovar Canicola]POR20480.1 hypothetical protein B0T34_01135 [Leptospira interrogans serovar Canicola]
MTSVLLSLNAIRKLKRSLSKDRHLGSKIEFHKNVGTTISSVYECESDCSENSEGIAALCCDSKEQH